MHEMSWIVPERKYVGFHFAPFYFASSMVWNQHDGHPIARLPIDSAVFHFLHYIRNRPTIDTFIIPTTLYRKYQDNT